MNALFALLALALAPTSRQDAPPQPAVEGDVLESQMRMEVFHPQHSDADDLMDLFRSVANTEVVVEDELGRRFERRTIRQLGGNALLVYEPQGRMTESLKLLARLDSAYAEGAKDTTGPPVTFQPRFVSLEVVEKAMRPFTKRPQSLRIYYVEDRGLALLQGEPARIEEALRFLREVDVPPPQALFRCYLVGPELPQSVPGAAPLPEALDAGLRDLVGDIRLQVHAIGVLRASLDGEAELSIRLQPSEVLEYTLAFHPSVYDAEHGALGLEHCSVVTRFRDEDPKELLTTQLSLQAGEYAVLGASGIMPRYVVLYFEPLER